MTGNLGKAARNSFLVVLVIAGLGSLVVPYRIITARIQESARERIAGERETETPLSPEWRTTIDELKGFVENARGLKFKHDVRVVLESADEFRERLEAEADEYYGEFEAEDAYVALKALHLVDNGLDLGTSEDPLQDGGTLGYFDPYSNRLVVQGEHPTPFVRQVLVHELTHALQDQHFNLDRELNDLDESYLAFEALYEGDATRIENLYLESLPTPEQDDATAEAEADLEAHEPEDADESFATLAMLSGFPYEVGEIFVQELFAAGGNEAVDRAFVAPPTTTEQVLHSERFLSLQKPRKVAPPKAEGDIYEEGVWGERGLLTLLLQTIPEEQAWEAADGWAGDYYVAWKDGGQSCVKMKIVTDSREDKDELVLALRAWALKQKLVSITAGKTIDVRSCA